MNNYQTMTKFFKSFGIMFLFFMTGLVGWGLPYSYYKLLEVIPESFVPLGIAFLSGLSLILYVKSLLHTSRLHHPVIRIILIIMYLFFSALTLLVAFRFLFNQADLSISDTFGVMFLGISSLVLCSSLILRATQFSRQSTRILLLIGLTTLGMIILLTVAFSTHMLRMSANRGLTATDIFAWLTAITGLITAISGLLAQTTAQKKAMLEIELEKEKLALEREKLDLERRKMSQRKRK